MTDGLSGISGIGGDSRETDSVEDRIRGVNDLESLAELLQEDRVVRGIERLIDEDEVDAEAIIGPEPRIDPEITVEQQLAELEQINDQIVLLRDINRHLIELNDKQERTNKILTELLREELDWTSNSVLDIDHKTISEAQKQKDLTERDSVESTSVRVKADPTNDSFLYIGQDDVTVNNGFRIEPGESETFDVDLSKNILKVISENAGDGYSYITKGED